MEAHPPWLMVYGEGQHIDSAGAVIESYPTRTPAVGIAGFCDYCFICQPTVVWRRSLRVLLGPFNTTLRAAFDFDHWLRAFSAFPERIGHIPHHQASTRVHPATISATQRPQALLEAAQWQARHFGVAGSHMLTRYFTALTAGELSPPPGESLQAHLHNGIDQARPSLSSEAIEALRTAGLPAGPSL